MSWMTTLATLKMTETELTRRRSVRTVTHINTVECGVVCLVWHAAKLPCVHPKRPRVYQQHVRTCKHMWVRCRYTQGRFGMHTQWEEGRRKGGEGHGQFCLPKCVHVGLSRAPDVQQRNPWMLPSFSLRIGREQHVAQSSIYSLHLNTLSNSRHMTQQHSTAQHSTAQHSTSTAQHSTQHRTRHTEARDEEKTEMKRDTN